MAGSGRVRLGRVILLAAGGLVGLLLGEGLVRGVNVLRSGAAHDRGGVERAYQHHDPVLGWRPTPGVTARHHTTEFDVTYAIGTHGFRQREPPLLRSNREDGSPRPRVLVLGDSFVFGQGVDESQRFTERVGAALDLDVLSVGIPGSGTDQQVLLYEELHGESGPFAMPSAGSKPSVPHFDVVVLGFLLEAVERNVSRRRAGRSKPRFVLDDAGVLQLTGVPVADDYETLAERIEARETSRLERLKGTLRRNSALYGLLRERFRDALRAAGDGIRDTRVEDELELDGWPVTRALLARLREQVVAQGARCVVIVIPSAQDLETATGAGDEAAARVLSACEDIGALGVDLTSVFAAEPACYFPVDGHWTAKGHRVAAEALASRLASLLPER